LRTTASCGLSTTAGWQRLEAQEQATIKAINPNAVGWFDLDSLPIMQEARRNRLATAKVGFDMGIPFHELNRVLDLGFKALPWGDAGFLPSKLQRLVESPAPAPAVHDSTFRSCPVQPKLG